MNVRKVLGRSLSPLLPVGHLGLDSLFGSVLPLAGVLLPLVTVVHTCAAERARQLAIGLAVMFNQLWDGAELTLGFLKETNTHPRMRASGARRLRAGDLGTTVNIPPPARRPILFKSLLSFVLGASETSGTEVGQLPPARTSLYGCFPRGE